MPLLAAVNIGHAFGERVILEGVSLNLEPGERIGIVGRNGAGKSTLMKILTGEIKPDTGEIILARGSRTGYLTQDPVLDKTETLRGEAEGAFAELHRLHRELDKLFEQMATAEGKALEELMRRQVKLEHAMEAAGGYAVDHKIEAVLHGLGFTDSQFEIPVAGLSGGQKGRLALAKLLLTEPDILLLDEPTNHLDIEGRLWLEDFLNNEFKGAVVMVSHDRYLLDNVVHRIIETEGRRLIEYPGNYADFRELRLERRTAMARAFKNEQTKFKKEEAFIRKYKAGQRAKQAKGRASKLERAKEGSDLERPMEMEAFRLELPRAERAGDIVLSCRGLSKSYLNDDGTTKQLFKELDLSIERGERWGIIGPNGTGKTTIVKTLLGEIKPDEGWAKIGGNVITGFYRQLHDHVDGDVRVYQYLQQVILKECPGRGLSEQAARNLAGAFLFSGDQQEWRMGQLSGGERSRAVLAGLLASAKNLLVLDEPTNHLDIPSAERLEEALAAPEDREDGGFEGTLILISHDRALIDATCDHLLVFDGKGGAEVFMGNYTDWHERQLARAKDAAQAESEAKQKNEQREKQKRQAEEAKKKEAERGAANGGENRGGRGGGGGGGGGGGNRARTNGPYSRMKTEQIEERIGKIDARMGEIDGQLIDPVVWKNTEKSSALTAERDRIEREKKLLEEEWLARG